LEPLAELGEADAQYYLGGMYHNGEGVNQDYKTAVKWYRLAADQGLAKAQDNLGFMYQQGDGVSRMNSTLHVFRAIYFRNFGFVQRPVIAAQYHQ
jgi:hypothetical protein